MRHRPLEAFLVHVTVKSLQQRVEVGGIDRAHYRCGEGPTASATLHKAAGLCIRGWCMHKKVGRLVDSAITHGGEYLQVRSCTRCQRRQSGLWTLCCPAGLDEHPGDNEAVADLGERVADPNSEDRRRAVR